MLDVLRQTALIVALMAMITLAAFLAPLGVPVFGVQGAEAAFQSYCGHSWRQHWHDNGRTKHLQDFQEGSGHRIAGYHYHIVRNYTIRDGQPQYWHDARYGPCPFH